METVRRHIESQVLSLTGLALGGVDFESPKGDPGLFGPDSVSWKVHGDFSSMLIGGISALLLQMLHPAALGGVWDHSNFRADMLGRLRRTGQFISATTYGSRNDAEKLIERVRRIHEGVHGTLPDGTSYAASDPDLLTWVHVAEVSCFLASHLRYLNPDLSEEEQDRYYNEIALIAERLGARNVPRSRAEVAAYLQRMRPQLRCDERTREVVNVLFNAPAPSFLAKPFGILMMRAGIDLLPEWATDQLGLSLGSLQRQLIRSSVRRSVPLLRWAVRNGSLHRARRRMGLPPLR
ncbi:MULTISPECIES: oxygenase MpaB family protein [Pseudomonas]|uniref:Histidine kinase n=1 Tax=Pseudomonas nitroreducens TaxID=46680 RepID=A0A246FFE6_PSENT|nr:MULTISPECIES: oxygenase MpaB family protein [Pseudomonas]MCG8909614.1 oxygenase MpaB family protein [Pseudomonas sp. DP-17]OWP53027.1 histidine kinase [Pseudomonas nitroreducens]